MSPQPTLLDLPARRVCDGACRPPATSHAHCAPCHRTFGSVSDFDRHRVDGHCVHPATLGLIEVEGLWASRERHENDARLAARLAEVRSRRPHGVSGRPEDGSGPSIPSKIHNADLAAVEADDVAA